MSLKRLFKTVFRVVSGIVQTKHPAPRRSITQDQHEATEENQEK